MKQTVVLRILAIILFVLASVAIKSETCCNPKLTCVLKKNVQAETFHQQNEFPLFPSDEGFLIKI